MVKIKKLFCIIITAFIIAIPVSALNKSHIFAANRDAGKYIALTFDDGPHPQYTAEILDILDEFDAKATFFVIGQNAEKYPDLIKREFSSGHEIGNHTYTHPDMKKISVDKAVEEILLTQNAIYDIIGVKPVLFRAPGGIFTDELVIEVEELDCKPILWSWRQDTKDWCNVPAGNIVNNVLNNIQNGDIILFHDFNTKGSPTPKALKSIIPKLKEMGYSFVTVSELLELNEIKDIR